MLCSSGLMWKEHFSLHVELKEREHDLHSHRRDSVREVVGAVELGSTPVEIAGVSLKGVVGRSATVRVRSGRRAVPKPRTDTSLHMHIYLPYLIGANLGNFLHSGF